MKKQALKQFLELNEEVTNTFDNYYECDGAEYLVLTDSEADDAVKEHIKDTAWAFNPDFIIDHSDALDYDDASIELLHFIQEQCEDGNRAILKLIDDIDDFVEDAISADGRGHFLAMYDGHENEEYLNGQYFYIYRTN